LSCLVICKASVNILLKKEEDIFQYWNIVLFTLTSTVSSQKLDKVVGDREENDKENQKLAFHWGL
jgi:hypothetical protein